MAVSVATARNEIGNLHEVVRYSSLSAPVLQLSGQQGEILTCQFNSNGNLFASGSTDKTIFLWNMDENFHNYCVLKEHSGAVLDLKWGSDSTYLASVSSDKSVILWNCLVGEKVRKFRGHRGIVNACSVTRTGHLLISSASDDKSVLVWDPRYKNPLFDLDHAFPVTAVSFSQDSQLVYSGGIDGDIQMWDLRMEKILLKLTGHNDLITGLELSPDGERLLSNSLDNTVRVWDVRRTSPYEDRCLKLFEGAPQGVEKNLIKPAWSADGRWIACGSGDRHVTIWDALSRRILYRVPGHKGTVNQVHFHPKQPVLASCGSDMQIFISEIDPNM